jgi:hypothetical protein
MFLHPLPSLFVSLFKPLCGIFKLFILFMQYFNSSNLEQQGWWLNIASFHSYQEKKWWYNSICKNSMTKIFKLLRRRTMDSMSKLLFIACWTINVRQVDMWYDLLNVVQGKLFYFLKIQIPRICINLTSNLDSLTQNKQGRIGHCKRISCFEWYHHFFPGNCENLRYSITTLVDPNSMN